jgi:hypothetical protein
VKATHALLASTAFALSLPASAVVALTATPVYNVLPYGTYPTITINYQDDNGNGLFEVSELVSFAATSHSRGLGSGFTIYSYFGLLTAPQIPEFATAGALATSFNGVPLPLECQTSWCLAGTTRRLGYLPEEHVMIYGPSLFSYAVSPVPEPRVFSLLGAGLLVLLTLTRRRRMESAASAKTPVHSQAVIFGG